MNNLINWNYLRLYRIMTILQPINDDLTFNKLFPQYVAIMVNFSLSGKKDFETYLALGS